MRKFFTKFLSCIFVFMLLYFPNVKAYESELCIKPDEMTNTVKKLTFENEFEYVLKFRCYPEAKGYDSETDCTIYKRKAEVLGEMFYRGKNKALFPEKILFNSLSVIFTYDKNGSVKVENPMQDIEAIKSNFGNDKWQTMCNQEILKTDLECIVSQVCIFHKNPKMSRHLKYIDNSHVDLICDVYGNIRLDSKTDY